LDNRWWKVVAESNIGVGGADRSCWHSRWWV